MARHHYVPRFLLRQWATDGRFVAYYRDNNANKIIENDKATVASACQIPDLNTFFAVQKHQRDFPETAYFSRLVDTSGANALRVMLDAGVRALTPKQRLDWARLIVSFAVRTPEALREMGPAETKKAFEIVKATAKGPPELERRVTLLIQNNMRTLERNFPLYAAMELSSDPQKLEAVANMRWWLRRWDRTAILIGDRPLLTFPRVRYPCGIPLNDPKCLIVLPLAPRIVFFASANPKTQAKIRRMTHGTLARIVNEESIHRSTCVYSFDKSLAAFIKARLVAR
jgi:hypothetical protein